MAVMDIIMWPRSCAGPCGAAVLFSPAITAPVPPYGLFAVQFLRCGAELWDRLPAIK